MLSRHHVCHVLARYIANVICMMSVDVHVSDNIMQLCIHYISQIMCRTDILMRYIKCIDQPVAVMTNVDEYPDQFCIKHSDSCRYWAPFH